jgi:hypothetical protein
VVALIGLRPDLPLFPKMCLDVDPCSRIDPNAQTFRHTATVTLAVDASGHDRL